MKKLLLLTVLLLAALVPAVRAQSANPAIWCPAGATWTYGYGLFNARGTVTVHYNRDTVVAGQSAQVLTRRLNTVYFPGPMPGSNIFLSSAVTRVVGDRVEVQANGQFYTLYDFAAQPGSSWLTAPVTPQGACPQGLVLVTVDSVGRQMVAGRSLRWFRARLTAAAGTTMAGAWPGRIYEQLGAVAYMQPQSPICRGTDPGFMGPLMSFRAVDWPTIGYNSTTGTLLTSAQTRAEAAGFTAYPNPTAGLGLLAVQLPSGLPADARLLLLDITGRQVRQQPARAGQRLDVRGLAGGTYTLVLREAGRPDLMRRLVLE